jgi:hypothetical protein
LAGNDRVGEVVARRARRPRGRGLRAFCWGNQIRTSAGRAPSALCMWEQNTPSSVFLARNQRVVSVSSGAPPTTVKRGRRDSLIAAGGLFQASVACCPAGGVITTTGGYWRCGPVTGGRVRGPSRHRLSRIISRLVGIAAPTPHTAPASTARASSLSRLAITAASVAAKPVIASPIKILNHVPRVDRPCRPSICPSSDRPGSLVALPEMPAFSAYAWLSLDCNRTNVLYGYMIVELEQMSSPHFRTIAFSAPSSCPRGQPL